MPQGQLIPGRLPLTFRKPSPIGHIAPIWQNDICHVTQMTLELVWRARKQKVRNEGPESQIYPFEVTYLIDLRPPTRLCILKFLSLPSGVKLGTKPLTHGTLDTFKIKVPEEKIPPLSLFLYSK